MQKKGLFPRAASPTQSGTPDISQVNLSLATSPFATTIASPKSCVNGKKTEMKSPLRRQMLLPQPPSLRPSNRTRTLQRQYSTTAKCCQWEDARKDYSHYICHRQCGIKCYTSALILSEISNDELCWYGLYCYHRMVTCNGIEQFFVTTAVCAAYEMIGRITNTQALPRA